MLSQTRLRVFASVFAFSLCGSNAVAQDSNVAALVAIKTICEPIVLRGPLSEIKYNKDDELWKHYVSRMFYSNATTIDEARSQGFSLNPIINGIPLSAIWSSDEKKRTQARTEWQQYVDQQEASKSVEQYSIIKNYPDALVEYNKCVTALSNQGDKPLVCFWTVSEGVKTQATFHVAFRLLYNVPVSIVDVASVTNGKVVPESNSKAPSGNQFPIVGKTMYPGGYVYTVNRLDVKAPMRATIQLRNKMNCSEELTAEPLITIKAQIWPTGKNWSGATQTFHYSQNVGCPSGYQDVPKDFCFSNPAAQIQNWGSAAIQSSNCPKGASSISSIAKISANCVRIIGHLRGCGYDQPFNTCKGRGWLEADIPVNAIVPVGQSTSQVKVTTEKKYYDIFQSAQYFYDQPMPEGFTVDDWNFSIEVSQLIQNNRVLFTLTNSMPKQNGCEAKAADPGVRDGYVQVICRSGNYLASDATKLLLPVTPISPNSRPSVQNKATR